MSAPTAHPPLRRRRNGGRRTPELVILVVVGTLLLGVGMVMTFSASFVLSAADTGDAFTTARRQIVWTAVGIPVALIVGRVDYRRWRSLATPLLVVTLIMCAVVLVPGIGVEVNGARRWFDLGPLRFQPSELAKLALAYWLAAHLSARWDRLRRGDLAALLWPAAPVTVMAAALVLAGPDLETAVLLAGLAVCILYTAGLPARVLVVLTGVVAAAATWSIVTTPFRQARMEGWLDPMSHSGTVGFQTVQGWIALGSGGVSGVGLGEGWGKWLYIPNPHTDFIFAIIGEELGLIGALAVVVCYAVLIGVSVRIARRAPDAFGRLLVIGIVAWLGGQATMNMGSVVGLLPVTGVTLPLISFGGSSLVITLAALGLLASVAARTTAAPSRG